MADATTAPVVPVALVRPSAAQIWSAAIQNCLIAVILGAAWLIGKIDATIAVPSLLGLSGIDLLTRRSAQASVGTALAVGSTTISTFFKI